MKLKDRLFVTILLLCLLPILLVSFIFYKVAKDAVYQQYESSIEEHLKQTDQRLELFVQMAREDARQLATQPIVRMTDGNLRHFSLAGSSSSLMTKEAEKVADVFRYYRWGHSYIKNIHLVTDDGGFGSLSIQPELFGKDPREWKVYREVMRDGNTESYLVDSIDPAISIPSMYLARRVENGNGIPFGLLLVELDLHEVNKQFKSGRYLEEVALLAVSKGNRVLLHPDPEIVGKPLEEIGNPFVVARLKERNPGTRVFSYMGAAGIMYGFQYHSAISGNTYVDLIPERVISRQLHRLELILVFVTLLVVLLSAYMAHRISNWISRPVSTLVTATDALRRGDFSARVPIDGIEEIRQLEKQFNEMAGQLQELLLREREHLKKELDQIVRSFYLAVEMKDPYTAGHTERVTEYALVIYDCLGDRQPDFSRDDLRYAGLMHDIGKVAIPDRVLLKEGKLTDEEYELIKLHASMGADIVEQIERLAHVSPGVRHHHERWDGRGYPSGLRGEEIPLMGRILAIADTFDAMTSTRSYRKALTAQAARDEIVRCSGTQFDPELVEIFCKAYENGLFWERTAEAEAAAASEG